MRTTTATQEQTAPVFGEELRGAAAGFFRGFIHSVSAAHVFRGSEQSLESAAARFTAGEMSFDSSRVPGRKFAVEVCGQMQVRESAVHR